MPDRFKHYLPLSDKDEKDIWEHGVIIFDTNILLHIYRMSQSERDNFLNIMKDSVVAPRLWLPYQVAEEFFRNRLRVINSQISIAQKAYVDIEKLINDSFQKVFNRINKYHPIINRNEWKSEFEKTYDKLREKSEKARKEYPFSNDNDPFMDDFNSLFNGKIGDNLTDLEARYKKAKARFKNKIPPGFCDHKKDGPDKGYGDYLIWVQALEEMNGRKLHMIFVTDDKKEDWWYIEAGKKIGPSPYLRKEYHDNTGKQFVICTSVRFIEWAANNVSGLTEQVARTLTDSFREHTRDEFEPYPLTSIPENPTADEIVEWVYENFEDPANAVPYDGREGGYQYVLGGHYELCDIMAEFFDDIDEDTQNEAVQRLSSDNWDWVRQGIY